jgi:hypothetical protein
MVEAGVESDAVTCCSLITALDKGGQWQLAEQVRAALLGLGRPRARARVVRRRAVGRRVCRSSACMQSRICTRKACTVKTSAAATSGPRCPLPPQVFIQMYREHPQFSALLEGMDTQLADASNAAAAAAAAEGAGVGGGGLAGASPAPAEGGGSSNGDQAAARSDEVVVRASSLLAGTFCGAGMSAGRSVSTSEEALPPAEHLLALIAGAPGADRDTTRLVGAVNGVVCALVGVGACSAQRTAHARLATDSVACVHAPTGADAAAGNQSERGNSPAGAGVCVCGWGGGRAGAPWLSEAV